MIIANIIPFEHVGALGWGKKLVEDTVIEVGKDALADFERLVEPWERKPTFDLSFLFTKTVYAFKIEPADDEMGQVFEWLDFGTEGDYPIEARRAAALSFLVPYRPSTRPHQGRGRSRRAKRGTTRVTVKRIPRHPGIEPRDFSIAMLEYWMKVEVKQLEKTLAHIARMIGPI